MDNFRNFSLRVKTIKRFCPICYTQEIMESENNLVVCTWCDCQYSLDELYTVFQIRNKKIEEILS
jgi:hypothetical protein